MMTEQQFQARWEQNREQRAAEAAAVAGKWDQADAMLLLESGWTQERIAAKVKKSQSWVMQNLCFARFLNYCHGNNDGSKTPESPIPVTLTERTFRGAWQKTFKSLDGKRQSEPARFEQAQAILEADYRVGPGYGVGRDKLPNAGKLVVASCKPGEWVTREQILADLEDEGLDETRLTQVLRSIHDRNAYGCILKEKRVGGKDLIQIRKLKGKLEIKAEKVLHYYEEVMPLLKEAKELTDTHVTTVCMKSILARLELMERLLKVLHEELEAK